MKLRQKSKRDQALDATASIAKTWSEWRLGEKVSDTASKASRKATKAARKAADKRQKSSRSGGARRKPLKIAALVALVGGVGAAVAKKLGGGKAEPLYTPTGPASDSASDSAPPPPSPVAVEGLAADPSAGDAAAAQPSDPRDGEAVLVVEDRPAEGDLAPEPEELVSDDAAPDDDESAGRAG